MASHGALHILHIKILIYVLYVVLMHQSPSEAIVVPDSNCYVFDNNSRLIDFTDWMGYAFEYNDKDADLVVRFCKDVESRSQNGYVDFGHFSSYNYFISTPGPINFVQKYYSGDLAKCEYTYDKMGRTSQVNLICGDCLHGTCRAGHGCICDVKYDQSMCRAFVELAIPCSKDAFRVFEGSTVGFHPRSWEIVYNGLTQRGYEKAHREFSFGTEQTVVSLFLTAISSLSSLVGKPSFKVSPPKGLHVKLAGSGAIGSPPTTLSPTNLVVNWRCELAQDYPYEVVISIPVQGYEPIEFTLTKICEYIQSREGEVSSGWATFGVVSCVFVVLSTLFCCGGFIYRVKMDHQRGLYAVPGITFIAACLEALTGPPGYRAQENLNGAFVNQASWERTPASRQESGSSSQRTYGTI